MSESMLGAHETCHYDAACVHCGYETRFAATTAIQVDDTRQNWCERCADIVEHRVVALHGGVDDE